VSISPGRPRRSDFPRGSRCLFLRGVLVFDRAGGGAEGGGAEGGGAEGGGAEGGGAEGGGAEGGGAS
jgi:hypothetical protein